MVQMQKVEGQVELKCSAEKVFEMITSKQQHVPKICSDVVPNAEAHQSVWTGLGSIRKWDFVYGGKSQCLVERIEAVDVKKMMLHRVIIDGEVMKTNYKALESKTQAIPKPDGGCIVKVTLEYEKLHEAAPEPLELLNLGGKTLCLVERIEAVDAKNMILHRVIIDGEIMKTDYKALETKAQAIPKPDGGCIVKVSLEYEKLHEAAPEPLELLNLGLATFANLGAHLSPSPNA